MNIINELTEDDDFINSIFLSEQDISSFINDSSSLVEFTNFNTSPIVSIQNSNYNLYIKNVQQALSTDTMVTMNEQTLTLTIADCQDRIFKELNRENTEELTLKLRETMLARWREVTSHLLRNVEIYQNYCASVGNGACEVYQSMYELYQRFLDTFSDAEIYLRNCLIFYLDEVVKLSNKRPGKGQHAKKLPKEATDVLWRWFVTHCRNPYPTESERIALSKQTGLEIKQINNWMDNHRRRYPDWKKGVVPVIQSNPCGKVTKLRAMDSEESITLSIEKLIRDDDDDDLEEESTFQVQTPIPLPETPTSVKCDLFEVCGQPTESDMHAIRAHTLLLVLGTDRMLELEEEEFTSLMRRYINTVLNDYENCQVITEDKAVELWKEAKMKEYENLIRYEMELEEEDGTTIAESYIATLKKKKEIEDGLFEDLLR